MFSNRIPKAALLSKIATSLIISMVLVILLGAGFARSATVIYPISGLTISGEN